VRSPDNDVTNAMLTGKLDQGVNCFFRAQAHDFRSQVSGSLFVVQKIPLQCRVDTVPRFAFGFDMDDKPIRVQPTGQARALPEEHGAVRRRPRRQTNHHTFAGRRATCRIFAVGLRRYRSIHTLRHLA